VSAWTSRLAPADLRVVSASGSTVVAAITPGAVRPGDLLVREPDDSFSSYRLVPRPLR